MSSACLCAYPCKRLLVFKIICMKLFLYSILFLLVSCFDVLSQQKVFDIVAYGAKADGQHQNARRRLRKRRRRRHS